MAGGSWDKQGGKASTGLSFQNLKMHFNGGYRKGAHLGMSIAGLLSNRWGWWGVVANAAIVIAADAHKNRAVGERTAFRWDDPALTFTKSISISSRLTLNGRRWGR